MEHGREIMCVGHMHAVEDEQTKQMEAAASGWRLRAGECLEKAELVP
jgi:hypothetical protein